jgi:hypothetical protein
MNVEDTNLGVAEYISSKHEMETIELKWGQEQNVSGGGDQSKKDLDRQSNLRKERVTLLLQTQTSSCTGSIQARSYQGI